MTKSHQVLRVLLASLLLVCVAGTGCARVTVRGMPEKSTDEAKLDAAIPQTRQLLVVVGEGEGSPLAKLLFLERDEAGWKTVLGPTPATVGRNGFAEPGEKREGDGKTPTGLFELEHVFGYAPSAATAMPYRQATEDDIWVDDPESPDYNRWVKRESTAASSFERMKLPDHRYRHGIVIGYNRSPVVKGMGSAIFIHVWEAEGKSTSGCVALDEAQLVRIISLLDPAKKPMILMGKREYIGPILSPEFLREKAALQGTVVSGPGPLPQRGRVREGDGSPGRILLASLEPAGFPPPDLPPPGGGELDQLGGEGALCYRSAGSGPLPQRGRVREGEGFPGRIQLATLEPAGFPLPDLPPPGGGELDLAGIEFESVGQDSEKMFLALNGSIGKADLEGNVRDLEQEIRARVGASAKGVLEHRGKEGFFGMALSIPKGIEQEMRLKRTWREDCPVAIKDLNYLLLGFRGFDGKAQVGELVVHRKLAQAVLEAFGELYALRFPIERMELIERYDGDDHRSMEANNTSAFNCREIAGRPGVFSNHSYGTAIDINPVQNPYVVPRTAALKALGWDGTGGKAAFLKKLGYPAAGAVAAFCRKGENNCRVSPPSGRPFVDRSLRQPGILAEGAALEAFTSRGFEWGGAWVNLLDYQHLEVKPASLK